MTKCADVNLMFNEVGKLLNDICKFINYECNNGFISADGKSTAKLLIERSRRQLEIITNAVSDPAGESYVDMHGAKANYEYQDQNTLEVYSDVSLIMSDKTSNTSVAEDDVFCPFENTPANMLVKGKRGELYRKEKILFFEKHREVYAAVQQPWLLIYSNKDSLKPNQSFDLNQFEAKPISSQLKDRRRNESFDLVCSFDPKLIRFVAQTEKDMLQWVCAINNSIEKSQVKNSYRSLPKAVEEIDLGDDTNDYEPLTEYQLSKSNVKPVPQIPLPLPPRNPKTNISRISSEESLSEYDSVEPTMATSQDGTSNSFSDDDSDQHYDDPAELKNGPKSIKPIEEDEDDTYDYLQAPRQQNIPVDEPKPVLKPKLWSFRNRKKD